MKLGDVLRTAGTAKPVVPRPVSMKIIGKGPEGHDLIAAASALFVFVDEDTRENIRVEARTALAAKFPGKDFADVLPDEIEYQLLYCALRDAQPGPTGLLSSFAASVQELRSALVQKEASRLVAEYYRFVDEEFPEVISGATFRGADQGGNGGTGEAAG